MNKSVLKSKKFWATVIGIALGPACRHLNIQITSEELSQAQNLIMFYIVGQGAADLGIYSSKNAVDSAITQNPEQLQTKEIT